MIQQANCELLDDGSVLITIFYVTRDGREGYAVVLE
jgi:hypothetical protein